MVYKYELMRFLSEDNVNALIDSRTPVERCYKVPWPYLQR